MQGHDFYLMYILMNVMIMITKYVQWTPSLYSTEIVQGDFWHSLNFLLANRSPAEPRKLFT